MSAADRIYLDRLTYEHFGGVVELQRIDFDDALTVLAGPNATGKSTAMAALVVALCLDDKAIHNYAFIADGVPSDKAEINLWLRGARTVHIRVRPSGREVLELVGEDWRVVRKPVQFISDLRDEAALTETFRDADVHGKVALLLEAIALRLPYSRDEALQAAHLEAFGFSKPIPDGLLPLEELDWIEREVRERRTGVGRDRDTEREFAARAMRNLPAQAPEEVGQLLYNTEAEAERLAAELARSEADVDTREREKLHSAGLARDAAVAALKQAQADKAAELRAAAEARIAELAAEMATAIDAEQTKCSAAEEEARAGAGKERGALAVKRSDLAATRERLGGLRERATTVEIDRSKRAEAQAAEAKAAKTAARYEELSRAIVDLRTYKARLSADLGIAGLALHFPDPDVKGGRPTLTLDGVPLHLTNTGRLEELSIEVAGLRSSGPTGAPRLRLALVDSAESIDPARLRARVALGLQIVAAVRTGDGPGAPLEVRHGDEALR